jgi:hypothetical protein
MDLEPTESIAAFDRWHYKRRDPRTIAPNKLQLALRQQKPVVARSRWPPDPSSSPLSPARRFLPAAVVSVGLSDLLGVNTPDTRSCSASPDIRVPIEQNLVPSVELRDLVDLSSSET